MDAAIWVPLVAGLTGAIIGSGTSILTVVVQTRAENQRRRREFITGLAAEERKLQFDLVAKSGGGWIMPLAVYVRAFNEMMDLADKDQLTVEKVKELAEKDAEYMAALKPD